MTRYFVLTKSANGTTVMPVPSEAIAKSVCVLAIEHGAYFAFYAK